MRTLSRHDGYRHPERCDAPQRGRHYRDRNGERFTVLNIRPDHIYVEYENGAIEPLCPPQWSLLRPCADQPLA